MTRQTAWEILQKYLTNPILLQHSLATEAVMRTLAMRYKEDPEEWGIVGLLHDADYEKSKNHPEEHGLLLFKLEPNAIPTVIEHAISSHNYAYTKVLPDSRMDWAITCCDELTSIITAIAQTTPEKKLANVSMQLVLDRLKDVHFAKEADRKNIYLCEEKLGISLPEFVGITLSAMQGIHDQLGL